MSLKDSVTILKDSYEVTTFRLDHFLLFFVHKLSRILLSSFFFQALFGTLRFRYNFQ